MAVKIVKNESTLILKYVMGLDKNGKDIIRNERFSKVKGTALPQDVYDVANSLGGLLINPVNEILMEDKNAVINE